jgi:hypothetical protein
MTRRTVHLGWLVCGALAMSGLLVSAQADKIAHEIARVRTDAQTAVPEPQRAGVAASLARAAAAADAGRSLQALFELQPAWEMQAAFAFSAGTGVTTQEQFERKWKAVGEPRAAAHDNRRRALFVEALAQSAEGKAPATYRASLPYAQDAGPMGGLYYLGESQAFGRFAAFCRSLDVPPAGLAPPLSPLDAQLKTIEDDILKAYDRAQGAGRPPFININVTLKLAKHLNEKGRRPGALLQYLLTRYRFALTRASTESSADVLQRLAEARTLEAGADHSIAQFFLQLAESHASGDGARPAAVAAILDDVLPAYWAVIK